MPKDYIPASDPAYVVWGNNFYTYAVANAAALGLVPAEVAASKLVFDAFATALDAHAAAAAAAAAATATKDANRVDSDEVIRGLVRTIQANPSVTDTQRQALGITVPDRSKTPVPPPSTSPLGVVDASARLTHTLRIADSAAPTRFARPDGVLGCEVRVKVGGEPPAGDEGTVSLGIATKAKFVATFNPADGNKTAWYVLRWVGTRGEMGPLGETVAATIAA